MTGSPQGHDSPAKSPARAASSQALDLARAKLKSAGLRITRPRLAILAELIRRDGPASIEQIHGALGAGRCDLVTVYRGMAAFEEIALVRRAFFPDGTGVYTLVLGETARYHVMCKRSRRTEEIDAESRAELSRALQGVEEKLRARGYTETGHRLEFFGVAPAPEKA